MVKHAAAKSTAQRGAGRKIFWRFGEFFPKCTAVPKSSYRIGRSKTGLGLFATRPFRKRQYIVTYRGRRIRNPEADRLEARGSRYMFEINSRWTIDGSRRWNKARYVNHSCRPNAEAVERRGPIIVYVARRKIKPGEEITVDYGKDYFAAFIGKSRCQCPKCRERRAERQAKYRARLRRAKNKLANRRKRRRSGTRGGRR
jgi:SET domain-containing protein